MNVWPTEDKLFSKVMGVDLLNFIHNLVNLILLSLNFKLSLIDTKNAGEVTNFIKSLLDFTY